MCNLQQLLINCYQFQFCNCNFFAFFFVGMQVPSFPVYTRSGEVTVSVNLLQKSTYSQEQLDKLLKFHHFVFTSVLHLEKDPMVFSPQQADVGYIIVPLNTSGGGTAFTNFLFIAYNIHNSGHCWNLLTMTDYYFKC